ncbi:cytochrome P450 [Cylindrobasidium torrendii FP15055 ss-10]|uniref:Cytochrome P450 n=1 Tax=Cylindrobasidium torrendii FP15055 ss-10 TaxID=1314674 RepID=A0A0D7BDE6_9AGAR|nr:cytochrome P450 [Cylindrobasidium torrendii FP15055 ss-10]
MSLEVLGTTTVVINDLKTVVELLERRSSNYSDRPSFRMLGDVLQTVSSNITAILALLRNPTVQEKSHEEILRVVGRKRMPTFEDRKDLKYIEAVLLETLRWRPVLPMGVAHAQLWRMTFMKGISFLASIILARLSSDLPVRGILHDPIVYKDPFAFNPERFMGSEPEPKPSTFGFGRRICPGRFLSENSSFILVASLVWAFEILPTEGEPLPDSMAYTDHSLSHPLPFKCTFKPRFDFESVLDEEAR